MRTPAGARTDTQRINANSVAHELVPLGLATRIIDSMVYRRDGSPSRLADIARTIAALAPLYTYSSDGSEVTRLTDDELLCGFFRKDGAELHFTDGRPPIVNIAATNHAIEMVAGVLASSMDGEERLSPSSPRVGGV